MTSHGFAVVGIKTTDASDTDRIIDVAVILLDAAGIVEKHWETIVNPDNGYAPPLATGLTASQLRVAPRIEDVIGEFLSQLNGRVLVTDHSQQTFKFLREEFKRISHPGLYDAFIQLATPETSAHDVSIDDASATSDEMTALLRATETAGLFSRIVAGKTDELPDIKPFQLADKHLAALSAISRNERLPRSFVVGTEESWTDWLHRVTVLITHLEPQYSAYWQALIEALADRTLTEREQSELDRIAEEVNFSPDDISELHELFVRRLVVLAWSDGLVTAREREWIIKVAHQLSVPDQVALSLLDLPLIQRRQSDIKLRPADQVAFSGALSLPREEWEHRAEVAGLQVTGAHKDCAVIIARNGTLSGNTQALATEHNIPVIDEPTFASLLTDLGTPPAVPLFDAEPKPGTLPVAEIFPWSTGAEDAAHLAAQWWDEHAGSALAELSPRLDPTQLPQGLDHSTRAMRNWQEIYTTPLFASVKDLLALPSIGPVKAKQYVYALVLQAIDESLTTYEPAIEDPEPLGLDPYAEETAEEQANSLLESYQLAAAWLDLHGQWPESVSEEWAATAFRRIGSPKDFLLVKARTEIESALAEDYSRLQTILSGRVPLVTVPGGSPARSLQEIGDTIGITRERVRQLESGLRRTLRKSSPVLLDISLSLRDRFGRCCVIDDIPEVLRQPLWAADCRPSPSVFDILLWLDSGTYLREEKWVINKSVIADLDQIRSEISNQYNVLPAAAITEAISDYAQRTGSNAEYLTQYFCHRFGYVPTDEVWVLRDGSIAERAAALLILAGKPLTTESIIQQIPHRSRNSITTALSTSDWFTRIDRDTWSLAEWNIEQWTSVSDFIRKRIHEGEGSTDVEQLRADLLDKKIADTTISTNLASPEFTVVDGMVMFNTDVIENRRPPEECRGMVLIDGIWRYLTTVTNDHLRGSGLAIPRGVIDIYGLEFDQALGIPADLDTHWVKWGRTNCTMKTIRPYLEQLGSKSGDRIWVEFGPSIQVLPAPAVDPSASGWAEVMNYFGLEEEEDTDNASESPLRRINAALGLSAQAPLRKTIQRLRHRREDDIAERIVALAKPE